LPYRFHYVPERYFINAFAVPGGHVYVGEGLLALMDSEDELAAVIGHEIEHIDHYHCAERVQQQQALRKIPLGELVALPVEIFEAGYSKDQELEADREGTRLSVQAGYSPNGANPSSVDMSPGACHQSRGNCRCPHKLSNLAAAVTAASTVATGHRAAGPLLN
jgi:predicted Zn-dependent protease